MVKHLILLFDCFCQLIRKRTIAIERVKRYLSETIEEHKATFDGDNIRDFIDLYIKAANDGENTALYTGKYFAKAIQAIINDRIKLLQKKQTKSNKQQGTCTEHPRNVERK